MVGDVILSGLLSEYEKLVCTTTKLESFPPYLIGIEFTIINSVLFAGAGTENYMGVSEMILGSALCGIIFSLFSGQPITIIGVTGPILVFEETLYLVSVITKVPMKCSW